MKKNVLITGGNGYIGTAIAWLLAQNSFNVVILDEKKPTLSIPGVRHFFQARLQEKSIIRKLLREFKISAVVHTAALTSVPESVVRPLDYYENNFTATLNLLDAMAELQVRNLIFSSSAAVYGISASPITEETATAPLSPYGKSKLFAELILPDYTYAFGLRYAVLRYFNVAGAIFAPDFAHGETHEPETHLIPLTIKKILQEKPTLVFGFELKTPDGSAIRDFVHLIDVAQANLLALEFLEKQKRPVKLNICSGLGSSVLQVIQKIEAFASQPAILKYSLPRTGDPEILVGNPTLAMQTLGWQPQNSDPNRIIKDAIAWHQIMEKRH
jgi:UDP-glucose 4-epimerase